MTVMWNVYLVPILWC